MRQLYTVLLMIVVWALVILGIRRLQSRFERQWFMAVLIQCIYFTVTMSRFVSIHQVPLPPVSKVFMRAFDVIAFDLSSLHSLARCWGWVDNYFNFLLWVTLVAPALLLVFVVCAVVRAVSRVACGATAAPQNALEEEGAAAEAVAVTLKAGMDLACAHYIGPNGQAALDQRLILFLVPQVDAVRLLAVELLGRFGVELWAVRLEEAVLPIMAIILVSLDRTAAPLPVVVLLTSSAAWLLLMLLASAATTADVDHTTSRAQYSCKVLSLRNRIQDSGLTPP